jgi:uncharacterized protein
VAGLVSIYDRTWTTDRSLAARRWGEVDATLAPGLAALRTWCDDAGPTRSELAETLTTTVATIVAQFASEIGLWST